MELYLRNGERVPEGTMLHLRELSRSSLFSLCRNRPRPVARYIWHIFRRWSALPGERFMNPLTGAVAELVEKPPGRPVRLKIASDLEIRVYGEDVALWRAPVVDEPVFERWQPC